MIIDLDYFYDSENEGALIARPQTATIEQLKQMIADGRPQKAITAYKQLVVNGFIWERFDEHQEALADYEKEVETVTATNEKAQNSAEDGEPVEQLDLPTEPVFEPFESPIFDDLVSDLYVQQRAAAYPSIADQLDKIYHEGIDALKADIQAIKDKYPKDS